MALTLHTCKVSKRGKGAQGTVIVQTFGVPVLVDGIAKSFDYDFAAKISKQEVRDAVKDIAHENILLLMAADRFRLSTSLKDKGQVATIAGEILSAQLAFTIKEAKQVAQEWLTAQRLFAKFNRPVPTLSELMTERKALVAGLKKAGQWIAPEVSQDVVKTPVDVLRARGPKLVNRKNKKQVEPVEEPELSEEELEELTSPDTQDDGE